MSTQPLKLALGFVTYGPSDIFCDRLKLINALEIPFYIFDNSSNSKKLCDIVNELSFGKCAALDGNKGLGVGIAEICERSFSDGFDALVFFDQDTNFTAETVDSIQNIFHAYYSNLKEEYSAIILKGGAVSSNNKQPLVFLEDVPLAINSGSLFFLRNLKKMGWHDKTYFVDGVDYEFCLRSRRNHFRIGAILNVPGFDHESEQPDRVVSLFGKRLLVRKYSASRIKDALHSYVKLIYSAATHFEFFYTFLFIKSMSIYILGQILSRLSWGRLS